MKLKKILVGAVAILIIGSFSGCRKSNKSGNVELTNKINSYIESLTKDKKFSGTVLVARRGEILTEKSIGNSNNELSIANSSNTKYRIGSLTNSFTAAAILQIEEKGFLSLDDTVSKYIPSYPKGDKITISQLINHTSGIVNYTNFEDFNVVARFNYPLSKIIDSFKSKPLEFAPGSKYKYSDSNYILLGYIIEKITGKKYADYLSENILKPLKMDNTGVIQEEVILKNRANGYKLSADGKLTNIPYQDSSRLYSSTGMYSTVGDLYLWERALYGEKIISKKEKDKIFNPEEGKNYCGGWFFDSNGGHKVVYQDSNILGFSGSIARFIKDDTAIIVLSNTNIEKEELDKIVSNISVYLF